MIGINANLTLAGAKKYFAAHKKYHNFVSLMSLAGEQRPGLRQFRDIHHKKRAL
jgi:hypothetical protein